MIKKELLDQRFIMLPDEFIISKLPKISINKSEIIKAINPESTYALIPRSHNKENLKFENESVKEMSDWIKKCEKDIVVELERFYD